MFLIWQPYFLILLTGVKKCVLGKNKPTALQAECLFFFALVSRHFLNKIITQILTYIDFFFNYLNKHIDLLFTLIVQILILRIHKKAPSPRPFSHQGLQDYIFFMGKIATIRSPFSRNLDSRYVVLLYKKLEKRDKCFQHHCFSNKNLIILMDFKDVNYESLIRKKLPIYLNHKQAWPSPQDFFKFSIAGLALR